MTNFPAFTPAPRRRTRRLLFRSWLPVARLVTALTGLGIGGRSLAAPLSVDDAVRLALAGNPQIKISAFSRDIARANVLAALGAFDPALTFRRQYSQSAVPQSANLSLVSFTQTDSYSAGLEGLLPWGTAYMIGGNAENERGTFNTSRPNYQAFGGISVAQPLLRGFWINPALAQLRVQRASRSISEAEYRQTLIDTVTNVVMLYRSLQQARANVSIAGTSRNLAAQLVEENQKKLQLGATSDAEVTQARARLATREEAVLIARRGARDTENQLRRVMGEHTYGLDGPELEVEELVPLAPSTLDVTADLSRAYVMRPDFKGAQLVTAISTVNRSLARNAMLPRVDVTGSYGYNGAGTYLRAAERQVSDREHRAYSAGISVSVPLTFTEGRGRARAAELALRRAQAEQQRLVDDIALAVSAAAGQIETTNARVEATRTALDLARQALDAEQRRFKAGTSNTFFVLQLQEQLTSVQNSYVRAMADQHRALAAYRRELGTTLSDHNIAAE